MWRFGVFFNLIFNCVRRTRNRYRLRVNCIHCMRISLCDWVTNLILILNQLQPQLYTWNILGYYKIDCDRIKCSLITYYGWFNINNTMEVQVNFNFDPCPFSMQALDGANLHTHWLIYFKSSMQFTTSLKQLLFTAWSLTGQHLLPKLCQLPICKYIQYVHTAYIRRTHKSTHLRLDNIIYRSTKKAG